MPAAAANNASVRMALMVRGEVSRLEGAKKEESHEGWHFVLWRGDWAVEEMLIGCNVSQKG